MDLITNNLNKLELCIKNNQYLELETERFELKDLSRGWGEDWYKTVCAFLNTNGGVIVIGISDKNNAKPAHYKFIGYDNSSANENHLKQELPKKFTDEKGNSIDLLHHITKFEIRNFLNGRIAIVYIEELDSEQKYVYFQGEAYIRKLTGDHKLSKLEIERYEEIKRDIIQHRELEIVEQAKLDDLDIDALNQYIIQFNLGKKRGETLKSDISTALPFLVKEHLAIGDKITLLGMLVCGKEPSYHLQGKCQADCYLIMPQAIKIAEDREIVQDNIVSLIERTFNFVWRSIRVGIAYTNSGIADPEYPELLIRECINNAFAHRDYKSERFIIVEVRPNESLMIRNPGMFERRQRINLDTEFGKIRRIVPFQVARNPKLTHLLKSFRYWEGKGRGLTSLIDACLDNEIDVPYYILAMEEIWLYIPKGKVFDDQMNTWLHSFEGYIRKKINRALTEEEKIVLSFFYKSETLNRLERYTILVTSQNNHNNTIAVLEECKLIYKNPSSPELFPVYQVDKTLMRTNFYPELESLFGAQWETLSPFHQEVLNAIYLHNYFALPSVSVSANSIATYIFTKQNDTVSNVLDYEKFRAKVRPVFTKLETKGFIVRKDGKTKTAGGKPNFKINEHFVKSIPSIY